jgi:hypothetical protein
MRTYAGASGTDLQVTTFDNNYHDYDFYWSSANYTLNSDGVLVNKITTNVPTPNLVAYFGAYNKAIKADYVFAHLYATPIPHNVVWK